MEIIEKRLEELAPAEINVRKHPEKQLSEYVKSVEMFGQTRPLLVDEEGHVLCGNGLYMALQRMGAETASCRVMAGLTESDKRKLMMADNRVYELGVTDYDGIEKILAALDDFEVPGWDEDVLKMYVDEYDVESEIESFGAIEPEAVERINNARPAQPQGAAPVVEVHYDDAPIEAAPAARPAAEPEPTSSGHAIAQGQRYVVCPNCGEKICL